MKTLHDLPEGSGRRFLFGLYGKDHDEPNCEKDGCADCSLIVHYERERDEWARKLETVSQERDALRWEKARLDEAYGDMKLQVREVTEERDRLKKCLEEVWLALDEFMVPLREILPASSLKVWEEACRKMRGYTEKRNCACKCHGFLDNAGDPICCACCPEASHEARAKQKGIQGS